MVLKISEKAHIEIDGGKIKAQSGVLLSTYPELQLEI